MDYARTYAEQHGLTLDESLSLRDEGLSAYHQAHVRRGALGAFLRAVEEGLVPKGSTLIVEGLDRLSRAEPIEAQAQLTQIINAGISVVTASDGKEYSRRTLKANPMDMIFSLLVMIRAHEESDTKSRRVRKQIHARIERWLDGSQRGIIRQGRDPRWVREKPDKSGFDLVPEYAEGVRFIVNKYIAGWGAVRITEAMNKEKLSAGTEQMSRGTVYRIIRNPALIGENRLEVDGKAYVLPDYYPAAIPLAKWHELQLRVRDRESSGRKGPVPAIITGIRTTYCGYCGSIMVAQSTLSKMRADGSLPSYARRIMCASASQWRNCSVMNSANIGLVEKAVVEYCGDALNLSALLDDQVVQHDSHTRLNTALSRHAEVVAAITRMTDQFLTMDKVPGAFTQRVNDLENESLVLQREIEDARSDIDALRSKGSSDLMQQWAELKKAADDLDADARLQVRELIRQTFRRIDVFLKGFGGAEDDGVANRIAARMYKQAYGSVPENPIDLVLHGRSGQLRIITIDRKSGVWRGGSAIDAQALEKIIGASRAI